MTGEYMLDNVLVPFVHNLYSIRRHKLHCVSVCIGVLYAYAVTRGLITIR